MKNIRIGVATSGGDAPGMNACIRAIVKASFSCGNINVIGINDGVLGLLNNDMYELSPDNVRSIINQSGTILGTSRMLQIQTYLNRQIGEKDDSELNDKSLKLGLDLMKKNIGKNKLDGLILIGGDDTCRAANLLDQVFNKSFPICVIPATIDNDIKGTDITIGFDSAVSSALYAIDLLRATASSHKRVFIVEVMGRKHGYIGLDVGIASGAEEILIPEIYYEEKILQKMARRLKNGFLAGRKCALVVVSEGVELNLLNIKTKSAAYGVAEYFNNEIRDWEIRVSVIGHIQRGAIPTFFTRTLALEMGFLALEKIINLVSSDHKKNSCMALLVGKKGNRYFFRNIPNPPTKGRDIKLIERHKKFDFLSY